MDIKEVIKQGYCIGCGVCRAVDQNININLNSFGEYVAELNDSSLDKIVEASEVCPFAANHNETVLAEEIFSGQSQHESVGRYLGLFAGYSINDRNSGSSGGIITYIINELFENNEIDYAILVRPLVANNIRNIDFSFDVISSKLDVSSGSTSFYYPVTYSKVLEFIAKNPGNYAITGIPCFHKAIRLLKRQNPLYRDRIKYQLGLVCGQLKSALYFEYLLRRAEVPIGKVESACFRRKDTNNRADEYLFEAVTRDSNERQHIYRISNRKISLNWGMGLFKPKACDFCDDVFAETADIAVMDGWLPQYINDGKGTSLMVIRDKYLYDTMLNGKVSGKLHLHEIAIEEIVKSQQGGLNHRRKGLAYRLYLSEGRMVPSKRIKPSSNFPFLFKAEQILRLILRKTSRQAMALQTRVGSGLLVFNLIMIPFLFIYRVLQKFQRLLKATSF
ncbi:Coenzyme F420 hydrogenase/dehydrogenase, beta subunit C-terminal domain [Nitrosomonas sp.]|uniref:Coenzyme F420 hydrogenase/dehydrogenase, beta subunit C-terminal domain n=1 Tax=Nitrosomonas sp. TaxID=42353 RepID=UPI001D5A63F7|nr:Coenzyme F420 hydrogenase/dehydrogenase, beta subunit C-terminal domain [Nitrosomonas sp.]MBX3616247.1 Coenzyme F420 hydrogenase/dehydrogenase, beta subunit C-terminal domain [Nitrosomonas sp.]